MANPTLILPLLLLAAPGLPDGAVSVRNGVMMAQLTIHQRIIVRIPRMPVGRQPIVATKRKPVEWKEKKGEKCVPMERLQGAMVTAADSIDLVMGGERLRAKLDDDCSPMDYYPGFYLKATPDGMVCAKRDSIRTRSGGACLITAFKRLVPKR